MNEPRQVLGHCPLSFYEIAGVPDTQCVLTSAASPLPELVRIPPLKVPRTNHRTFVFTKVDPGESLSLLDLQSTGEGLLSGMGGVPRLPHWQVRTGHGCWCLCSHTDGAPSVYLTQNIHPSPSLRSEVQLGLNWIQLFGSNERLHPSLYEGASQAGGDGLWQAGVADLKLQLRLLCWELHILP